MGVAAAKYDQTTKIFFDGTVDFDTDTLKIAMVTSSYTPSAAHTQWSDASGNEVATGSGYTTGGETLASAAVTNTGADAADVTWSSLTKTFRYLVVYANVTRNGLTNPLICYFTPDDTPADVTVTAADYTFQFHTNGIFTFT